MHRRLTMPIIAMIACISCGAEDPGVTGALPGTPMASAYPEKSVVAR